MHLTPYLSTLQHTVAAISQYTEVFFVLWHWRLVRSISPTTPSSTTTSASVCASASVSGLLHPIENAVHIGHGGLHSGVRDRGVKVRQVIHLQHSLHTKVSVINSTVLYCTTLYCTALYEQDRVVPSSHSLSRSLTHSLTCEDCGRVGVCESSEPMSAASSSSTGMSAVVD
jgi:hypothetical protein